MLLFEAAKLRGELSVQRGELTRWQWWLWTWWSWWSWWSWWTWWLWLLWTWWSWWSWWTWWLQLRQYVCDVLTILLLLDCMILSLNYFVLKPANCSPMHWWSRSIRFLIIISQCSASDGGRRVLSEALPGDFWQSFKYIRDMVWNFFCLILTKRWKGLVGLNHVSSARFYPGGASEERGERWEKCSWRETDILRREGEEHLPVLK